MEGFPTRAVSLSEGFQPHTDASLVRLTEADACAAEWDSVMSQPSLHSDRIEMVPQDILNQLSPRQAEHETTATYAYMEQRDLTTPQFVAADHSAPVHSRRVVASSFGDQQLERSTFRMVGTITMLLVVLLVVVACVVFIVRPSGVSGRMAAENDERSLKDGFFEDQAKHFNSPIQHETDWRIPRDRPRRRTRATAPSTAHPTRHAATKSKEAVVAARPETRRQLACVFTFGEATVENYPDDGVCDYSIYVQLFYRRGGIQRMHGPHKKALKDSGLQTFLKKSKEAKKTIFLASFSSDILKQVSEVRSREFAVQMYRMSNSSNIRGFGILNEYLSGGSFYDHRHELADFLAALGNHLQGIAGSLIFFGARLYRLHQLVDSSQYIRALKVALRRSSLFIMVTHVSSHHRPIPEPTAAWTINAFNDKDTPSLELALAFLKVLHPPRNVTIFLSLTLAVVQYHDADNDENPPSLGGTCKGSSLAVYREMGRVQSEAGSLNIGWALFNAEFEDNSENGCARDPSPFRRLLAVRMRLDSNVSKTSGA
ncbi:uncharacterized protein LOC135370242 isoform X2 [Ornithodoros turicata]|uniref:uncharacterized protein LOC135370242 isoform X2 n=1 Tax=Ornithodoros turicata TaxID=34597 RepID=UPI003139BE2B